MQLKNKYTLLTSATLLALAPCVIAISQPAIAETSGHALSGFSGVAEDQMDGYQSASASVSAASGTSYLGVGLSNQLITNPITLAAVPNFDFGYHRKKSGVDTFSMISGKNRYLVVNDQNGYVNWNVTAALGANEGNNLKNSRDISITMFPTTAINGTKIQMGKWVSNEFQPDSSITPAGWAGPVDGSNIMSNSGLQTPTVFQYDTSSSNYDSKNSAVALSFDNSESAKLKYVFKDQPAYSARYVAPITWTLSITI